MPGIRPAGGAVGPTRFKPDESRAIIEYGPTSAPSGFNIEESIPENVNDQSAYQGVVQYQLRTKHVLVKVKGEYTWYGTCEAEKKERTKTRYRYFNVDFGSVNLQ